MTQCRVRGSGSVPASASPDRVALRERGPRARGEWTPTECAEVRANGRGVGDGCRAAVTWTASSLLGLAYLAAPEHAQTTTMAAVLVGALALVHRRLTTAAKDGASGAVPLGDGAVVKVSSGAPEAFLLSVRALESGAQALVCAGACPDPAIHFVLCADDALSVPSGGRRVTFEVDGLAFAVVHRGAGALVEGVRSGEALASLRVLAAFGRPSATMERGRMQVRVEGSCVWDARPALVALAQALHRCAAEPAVGQTIERGAYR